MTQIESSQRQRSKAKRRITIQRAAMRLFAERGYDGATLADIAEEAEVAPRTVSMYFPSKLDIATSTSRDITGRFVETFQDHPGLSFTDAVDLWLATEAESADPELAAMTTAMFRANPALRAVWTTQLDEVAEVAGPSLLIESGLDPDDPILTILGAAIGAMISEYLTMVPASVASEECHQSFVRYLRAVIVAGRRD